MSETLERHEAKVPAVTLSFWCIKILATTLGETGGDAVTMTAGLGYLAGTAIFAALLLVLLVAQFRAARFYRFLYWAVIVATTTVGTTLADFCDRSLGIGYTGGSLILLTCLLATLFAWRATTGRIASDDVASPRTEAFYWATILFSQTLGTALGDFLADTTELGYLGGAAVFGTGLAVVALLWWRRLAPVPILFWAAFILTRPLGATLGDFLDKPLNHGGLALGRVEASAVLLVSMIALILIIPQRPGQVSRDEGRHGASG